MAITLKILKRGAGGPPTLYATRDLDLLPASIGRDAGCTIALEDPNKHMSRFHVEIEEESGVYWMSVVSKVNPVLVKGRRYGPGARLALNSGDSFELADYEVQVLLPEAPEEAEPARVPMPAETAPGDDDAERLFNESTFFNAAEQPAQVRAPSTDPQLNVLMQAETSPGEDPAEQLFNESTFLGTDRAPPARAPAKRTLDDATPLEGAGLAHELALMAGMRAALVGALRRLDPSVLERAIEKDAKKGLSLAGRKAKLWDLFVEQQEKLAQEDFNKAFGREFMSAYQAELRRLKGGR